jgi:hypothetical protein
MQDYPEFNRWLLDLTAFISTSGGIDPSLVPGTVITGAGPPSPALGQDGNLYVDSTGSNSVIPLGILAEGTNLPDASNTYIYAKLGGVWVLIG